MKFDYIKFFEVLMKIQVLKGDGLLMFTKSKIAKSFYIEKMIKVCRGEKIHFSKTEF